MTRKLIVSVLVSLDGYIADEKGSVLALERFYRDHLPAGVVDWRVPRILIPFWWEKYLQVLLS